MPADDVRAGGKAARQSGVLVPLVVGATVVGLVLSIMLLLFADGPVFGLTALAGGGQGGADGTWELGKDGTLAWWTGWFPAAMLDMPQDMTRGLRLAGGWAPSAADVHTSQLGHGEASGAASAAAGGGGAGQSHGAGEGLIGGQEGYWSGLVLPVLLVCCASLGVGVLVVAGGVVCLSLFSLACGWGSPCHPCKATPGTDRRRRRMTHSGYGLPLVAHVNASINQSTHASDGYRRGAHS